MKIAVSVLIFSVACIWLGFHAAEFADWAVSTPIFGPHYAIARWLILLAAVVAVAWLVGRHAEREIERDSRRDIGRQHRSDL
jgi:hypothetical protein